eukprot:6209369-Pleurochrysis_carterae.AAC.2
MRSTRGKLETRPAQRGHGHWHSHDRRHRVSRKRVGKCDHMGARASVCNAQMTESAREVARVHVQSSE